MDNLLINDGISNIQTSVEWTREEEKVQIYAQQSTSILCRIEEYVVFIVFYISIIFCFPVYSTTDI
jgi:hypothetical protein